MTSAVMPRTIAYGGDLEGGQSFEAVMTYQMCSDGMADNLYGLSIKLRLSDGEQELSGCCTLQR